MSSKQSHTGKGYITANSSVVDLLRWLDIAERATKRANVTSVIKHRIRMKKLETACEKVAQKKRVIPVQEKVSDLVPTDFEEILAYILDNICKDRPSRILTYIADLLDECMDERALYRPPRNNWSNS